MNNGPKRLMDEIRAILDNPDYVPNWRLPPDLDYEEVTILDLMPRSKIRSTFQQLEYLLEHETSPDVLTSREREWLSWLTQEDRKWLNKILPQSSRAKLKETEQ